MMRNRVLRAPWTQPSARAKVERAKAYNAKRDPAITAMYRCKQWFKLRARVKHEEPVCRTRFCGQLATDVDHIRPHKGDPRLFFDRGNLQALCHGCHSRKTSRFDGGFGN